MRTDQHTSLPKLGAAVALGMAIALWPVPHGLTAQSWQLFAIFLATIVAVVAKAVPVFTAAILAAATAILTRTLTARQTFSGFSEDFILLIVVAFLMSRGMVKSGLGRRIAFVVIRRIGASTLGLAYSMAITDAVIAPAFPSNTARSGVLYPIIRSICLGSGSDPEDGSEKKLGSFLMMSGMAGLSISSALWLSAMAANPVGAKIAGEFGVSVTFGSWLLCALVPSLCALGALPYLLYRFMAPTVRRTPEAPRQAAEALAKMGPVTRSEWITAAAFVLMIAAWALPARAGVDRTAVALAGLGLLMLSGIYTVRDLAREGEALEIWIWFAVLYTLSTKLNELGFMEWIASASAARLRGLGPTLVALVLVLWYVALHYLFVSQSAHLLALFGVFLGVAKDTGASVPIVCYLLLFATNFFSCLTPQGSSANVLFAGSGYLTGTEIYRYGGLVTVVNTAIYLTVGTAWLWLVL